MTANIAEQAIQAALMLGLGAIFGVKYAFLQAFCRNGGAVLRALLELTLGISSVIQAGWIIYITADGVVEFYHIIVCALSACAFAKLAGSVLRKHDKFIKRIYIAFTGKKSAETEDENAGSNRHRKQFGKTAFVRSRKNSK